MCCILEGSGFNLVGDKCTEQLQSIGNECFLFKPNFYQSKELFNLLIFLN